MRLLFLLTLCVLFASSINSDLTIEVVFPVSDSSDTQIYISTEEGEGGVFSVSHTSYSSDDPVSGYTYDQISITGNDLSGDSTSEDDLLVGISYAEDNSSTTVNTGYETSTGEWGYANAGEGTYPVDENTTETSSYVWISQGQTVEYEDYYYDEATGEYVEYTEIYEEVYVDDFIEQEINTTVIDGVYYEEIRETGSVDGVAWESETEVVTTGDENGGAGTSEEEFTWWVITQQTSEKIYSVSPVVSIGIVFVVGIGALLLYKKIVQAKRYRINNTVRAVDEEAIGYIRI